MCFGLVVAAVCQVVWQAGQTIGPVLGMDVSATFIPAAFVHALLNSTAGPADGQPSSVSGRSSDGSLRAQVLRRTLPATPAPLPFEPGRSCRPDEPSLLDRIDPCCDSFGQSLSEHKRQGSCQQVASLKS